MNRPLYTVNITGKNSDEVYAVSLPENLLNFINYDFALFMRKCAESCRAAMKRRSVNHDEVLSLRNSIIPCHIYYERNINGIFKEIAIDCWITYICRQNDISAEILWESFSGCRNEFEMILFRRLCDFRYNKAINQWNNLLKIQEYATKKTDFIFGKKAENHFTAVARGGYFDLFFNTTVNEMKYGELSANKVYSGLGTPNSPLIMNDNSRKIIRNSFPEFLLDTNPDSVRVTKKIETYSEYTADKTVMEAFNAIKEVLPDESDGIVRAVVKSIPFSTERIYIPDSFKSVIDLEIDTLLENGAILQKCGRCLEYFLRDEYYDYDYCSRSGDSRTCLDIMTVSEQLEPELFESALPEPEQLEPVQSEEIQSRHDSERMEKTAEELLLRTKKMIGEVLSHTEKMEEELSLHTALHKSRIVEEICDDSTSEPTDDSTDDSTSEPTDEPTNEPPESTDTFDGDDNDNDDTFDDVEPADQSVNEFFDSLDTGEFDPSVNAFFDTLESQNEEKARANSEARDSDNDSDNAIPEKQQCKGQDGETPSIHKTKRVLDSILKTSKITNPFVNPANPANKEN